MKIMRLCMLCTLLLNGASLASEFEKQLERLENDLQFLHVNNADATRDLSEAEVGDSVERVKEWRRRRGRRDLKKTLTHENIMQKAASTGRSTRNGTSETLYEIPVVFHVLLTSEREGKVSEEEMRMWVDDLNDVLTDSPLSFSYREHTETIKNDWYKCTKSNERQFKSATRLDEDADVLNVWLCQPQDGVFGWSSRPQDYADDPALDGAVVFSTKVESFQLDYFSRSDTLKHLTGHWLGLVDTFTVREYETRKKGTRDVKFQAKADTRAHFSA